MKQKSISQTVYLKSQRIRRKSSLRNFCSISRSFVGVYLLLLGLLFSLVPLSAVTVSLPDLSVPDGDATQVTLPLPAGAEYIRVSGDWSSVSGNAQSDDFELTVVGPGEITGFLPVFSNAADNSDPIPGLEGILRLTSTGGAGDYDFAFTNGTESSEAAFQNGSVQLLTLIEEFVDNASVTSGSATFERPEENGSPSGRTTRYAAFSFTPSFSGSYSIASQQVGFDGLIALYSGDQNAAPFSGFITANDDSAAGESFSQLQVDLTAGQSYTLVTTSFSSSASGSFTNRIRSFSALSVVNDKATTYEDYAARRSFVGGPEADDSGNGLANLLEYALGREADSSFAAPLESFIRDDRLVGRFYRDPELTDIAYILEATSDLAAEPDSWEVLYNSTTDLQANADDDFQEITDSELLGHSRFFRLRIVFDDSKSVTYADYALEQGLGEPEADGNSNGIPNLLEYALGRTADSPYAAPLESFIRDDRLVGRFYRDPELTDIAYILEATSDLTAPSGGWEVIYNSAIDLQLNADGTFQEIEDVELLGGQRFFRLRIVFLDAKPLTYAGYAAAEGLGDPEVDDNNNGLPNLLEYALGRVADSPYAPPLETFVRNNRLIGRFYRDAELTDIAYVLEATSDLRALPGDWEVLYDSEIDLQPNAEENFQEIEDTEVLSGQRFFRLRIRLAD